MATLREDPYPAYSFLVELDSISGAPSTARAGFSEVSGLGVEIEVIEYRNGNDKANTVRKLPGLAKYPNLVLKRGITGDLAFWEWVRATLNGELQRVNGTLTLLDEQREPVMQFRFLRGWPCKWTGPGFNATGNEVAMETLEICHEGLVVE